MKSLKCMGLFAGIGGIEEGLRLAGHEIIALCEVDAVARQVLQEKFSEAELRHDVKELKRVSAADVLSAGFPCQDLSPAGRTLGIDGANSSLVSWVFGLLERSRKKPRWLILENVPFMLHLQKGKAIKFITKELERLGWAWAYRTIDTRAFGLPQRRNRVILLASSTNDPRQALLGEDAGVAKISLNGSQACGFYWTEGNTGLGWAEDAIPPLKGGSGCSIPSPPAIWFPKRRLIVVPSIQDAERLQGFAVDWTAAAKKEANGERKRWRLIGNAVSVPVAEWVGRRIAETGAYDFSGDVELEKGDTWPPAAWGLAGRRCRASVSAWPVRDEYMHLAQFLSGRLEPLSAKATRGFTERLEASKLRYRPDFLADLKHQILAYEEEDDFARRGGRQSSNGSHPRARQPARERTSFSPTQKRAKVQATSSNLAE